MFIILYILQKENTRMKIETYLVDLKLFDNKL